MYFKETLLSIQKPCSWSCLSKPKCKRYLTEENSICWMAQICFEDHRRFSQSYIRGVILTFFSGMFCYSALLFHFDFISPLFILYSMQPFFCMKMNKVIKSKVWTDAQWFLSSFSFHLFLPLSLTCYFASPRIILLTPLLKAQNRHGADLQPQTNLLLGNHLKWFAIRLGHLEKYCN